MSLGSRVLQHAQFCFGAKLAKGKVLLAEKLWVDGLEVELDPDGVPGTWYDKPYEGRSGVDVVDLWLCIED